jgi:hypothetical protein
MVQVSLVGYAVGGAFQNQAYFDLPYEILVAIVLTRVMLEKQVKESAPSALKASAATPGGQGAAAGARLDAQVRG